VSENLIRIATRRSPLALWQAEHVAMRLRQAHPALATELVQMTTRGDKLLDAPLAKMGGKGLFVKELEQGMLEGRADLAVHSMKDVPVELPAGLHLAAMLPREDPRDAFISNRYGSFQQLPARASIGTASLRRQCQIKERYPACRIVNLRGNVNTRLARLDDGEYDAIVLAVAGLKRLGLADHITEVIPAGDSLPAIGQGVIGIECRSEDARVNALLSALNDDRTAVCIAAERALNERLRGGCQVPMGGFAELDGDRLVLRGLVGLPDGSRVIRVEVSGPKEAARALGIAAADDLLARGADAILKQVFA
jgi:hydroxymethylbilane synthase